MLILQKIPKKESDSIFLAALSFAFAVLADSIFLAALAFAFAALAMLRFRASLALH